MVIGRYEYDMVHTILGIFHLIARTGTPVTQDGGTEWV